MQDRTNWRAVWLLAAFVTVLSAVAPVGQGEAQSGRQLRRRLNRIENQKAHIRSRLRDAKDNQLTARNELTVAQRDLAEEERQLRAAESELAGTRASIRRVKKDLANTEATLDRHRHEMEQRILVMYKAGTPTYLEVLLNATDFSDFVNRVEFNSRVAAEDTSRLQAMLEYQQRRERQRAQLRSKEAEQAALRTRVKKERDEVARKKQVAAQLLKKANTDRATYERQLAEMEAASAAVGRMLASLRSGSGVGGAYAGKWAGTFAWPLHGRITSPFGMRIHPILGTRRMHTGVDIAAPGGTPIRAAADGRVVSAGWNGAYGVCVIIDHGSGKATLYGHLQGGSLQVCTGQNVSRGQTIGRCGSTGWSTGNHLHFEVRQNGSPVNPMNYL